MVFESLLGMDEFFEEELVFLGERDFSGVEGDVEHEGGALGLAAAGDDFAAVLVDDEEAGHESDAELAWTV